MKIWYSCKVKFTRETEDGFLKQVTENYMLDAVSYTEAETRIYELMEQNVRGEFSVNSISKTNISEIINYEDEESWFKSKVTYSTVDADKGKEVKVTSYYLVSAENVKQAFERIEDSLSSMLVPFDIPSIALTNVVEVFPYISEEDREPDFQDNRASFEPSTQFEEEEEDIEEESEEIPDEVDHSEEDTEEEIEETDAADDESSEEDQIEEEDSEEEE